MTQQPQFRIVDITPAMLQEAANLAYGFWKDESDRGTPAQRVLLYQYLVHYYYHPESTMNIAVMEQGRLAAFILAQPALDRTTLEDAFLNTVSEQDDAWPLIMDYKAYLDGNQRLEDQAAEASDVILSLFMSRRHGCGRMLLEELQRRARQGRFSRMILWTDDTCDYDYYPAHGFDLVLDCPIPHPFSITMHRTLLYSKPFG